MDKRIKLRKKLIEKQFNDLETKRRQLSTQLRAIDQEQFRLQGEFRCLESLEKGEPAEGQGGQSPQAGVTPSPA